MSCVLPKRKHRLLLLHANQGATANPDETRDCVPPTDDMPRQIPLSSATKLRAPLRLPHSTFSSSDVTRRKPPARAASRSADDRESRSALLAPAVDREGHPAPQSRPERPRSREQEPRLPHTATETSPSHPKSMTKLRFLALFLLLFLCYACVIHALFMRRSCVILALFLRYSCVMIAL